MAEGVGFPFPSLPLNEGRTYGQPEVVLISLPQVATGLRLRLPGSFRRRGFQPDLLMPQEALFARGAHSMQAVMHRALLRRGRSGNTAFSKTESNVAGNLCRMCRKGESRHGDFSQTCSCRRGHSCAEGVPTASLLPNQKKMLSEINAGYGRKGESYHGDISLYSKDCRAQ